MDVGMEDEGAAPGVEHTQHAQLCAQASGIAGEILQCLGAGSKQEVQPDLLMRADEPAQLLRDSSPREIGIGWNKALGQDSKQC